MQRRLPHESPHLVEQLAAWIDWRYAGSSRLVLTSAPTSLPLALERWKSDAVWRLAWQSDGAAVLYGIASGDGPTKFSVIRHDAPSGRVEGVFERLPDATWRLVDGDSLAFRAIVTPLKRRKAA